MLSLDKAHVDHLSAIKDQLQRLDDELLKIIEADPGAAGSGGPGMGPGFGAAGSGVRSTEADRRRAAIMATDTVRPGSGAAGSGDSQRRFLSRSGPTSNQGDLDNSGSETDDDVFMSLPRLSQPAAGGEHFVRNETDRINALPPLRGTTDTPGPTPDPSKNYLGASPEDLLRQQQSPHTSRPRPRQHHVTSPEEDRLLALGLSKAKSGSSPFSRSIRGGQRGGYIAVKKTRSKSSSSSGRRGTRRSSSSRSKSTRRRRHRGSSSSTRSSRR